MINEDTEAEKVVFGNDQDPNGGQKKKNKRFRFGLRTSSEQLTYLVNLLYTTTILNLICLLIVMCVLLYYVLDQLEIEDFNQTDEAKTKFRGHLVTDFILYLFVTVVTFMAGIQRSKVLMAVVAFCTLFLLCIQIARVHLETHYEDIDEDNDFFYGVGYACDVVRELEEDGLTSVTDGAASCRAALVFRGFSLLLYIVNFIIAATLVIKFKS